jgi:hypothetical protein
VVPGAPHSMYWEAPDLFCDAVERFLARIYGQGLDAGSGAGSQSASEAASQAASHAAPAGRPT